MNEYTCYRISGPYKSPPIVIHATIIQEAEKTLDRQYPCNSTIDEIRIQRTKSDVETLNKN